MGALTHNGEVLQSLPANASQINFDKTGTNLNSTQTEAAIKEVNTKVNTNTEDITQLKSGLMNLVRSETVTLSDGIQPGDGANISISDVASDPKIVQIMEPAGGKALVASNWWVSSGTLTIQIINLSTFAYPGGNIIVNFLG